MKGRKQTLAYWACQVIGWAGFVTVGLVFIALYPSGPPLRKFVLAYGAAAIIGIAISHAYRNWLRRRGWPTLPPLRLLPRVIGASVLVGAAITLPLSGVYWLIFDPAFLRSGGWSWVFPAVCTWSCAMFVWNLAYFGHDYFQQVRQAQIAALRRDVAAKDAELRGLIAQLNPHFLFNSLNGLRGLIGEDPSRAQAMVTELAGLLRYSLASERRPLVALGEELEAVQAYLRLEGIRLEERLHATVDASEEARAAAVPPMLVQTLVENGIKHGVATLPQGGEIRIEARVAGGRLELEVCNSGTWTAATGSACVGLENARERLRLLYDGAGELEVGGNGAGMVRARVALPVRRAECAR